MAVHVPRSVAETIPERPGNRPLLAADVARDARIRQVAADEYLGRLVRSGALVRRGPGVFTAPRRGRPRFDLTPLMRRAHTALREALPMTPVVGWTTEWVAPFAHNVPVLHWIVLEAPAFALTSLGDALSRNAVRAVINPSPEGVADLLRLFERPVILWPHGDSYAAEKRPGVRRPTPERLVVDLYFAATRRGVPYPANDLALVVSRIVSEGDLNVATTIVYARRRAIAGEWAAYLGKLPRVPPDVAGAIEAVVERASSGKRCTPGEAERAAS